MEVKNPLFVFIDESGNLDFSEKGTKNFLFSAVLTREPVLTASTLQRLKYNYLCDGINIESFHASEDKQMIRNSVFTRIDELADLIQVYYVHALKDSVSKDYRNSVDFYSKLAHVLVKHIMIKIADFDNVIIIFDKCLNKRESDAFLKTIKPELKQMGKDYRIYFHRTLSDYNGQIADYFAWAKYVQLERSERRPLNALRRIKMRDIDLNLTS